ncbi:hypothetical protein [Crateriforma spongiae]|uniref:hypothetical protein n=1 Tax=Crateriforma spongiae TaxID=2724528 RepID=UPI001444AD0A|nr:hypothetical protein [Crateriforma spongiae]
MSTIRGHWAASARRQVYNPRWVWLTYLFFSTGRPNRWVILMRIAPRFLLALVFCFSLSCGVPRGVAPVVRAQNGSFLDELFRSIAAAKAQREAEERRQAEQQRQQQQPRPSSPTPSRDQRPGGRSVDLPSSFFPPGPDGRPANPNTQRISPTRPDGSPAPGPNQTSGRNSPLQPMQPRRGGRNSISVKSQEAAQFVRQLVDFASSADQMAHAMRDESRRIPALRPKLGEAYRLAADSRTLIERCDGLASLDQIHDPYCEIDARWRTLSFELRSINGLPDSVRQPLRRCDGACSAMAKMHHVQPQFDRVALREVLITASAHLLSLEDDLRLAVVSPQRAAGLTSECRKLRQIVIRESGELDRASYDQAVTEFNEFSMRYRDFAARCSTIDNPHVQARLDRIAQCGTDTYALLWMTPPAPAVDIEHLAQHLNRGADQLLGQLNFGSLFHLPKETQLQIFDLGRSLSASCDHLVQEAGSGASRSDLVECVSEIQRSWDPLQRHLASVQTIPPALVDAVGRDLVQICAALGIDDRPQAIDMRELVELAAALEGSSEYLRADVDRYERYMQPGAYRVMMDRSSDRLYDQSKRLHAELSRGEDLQRLQSTTDRMLEAWDELSAGMQDLDRHGLSPSRADRLRRSHQELLPIVARLAAALSSRQ